MFAFDVFWGSLVLVSSRTQVQPQAILEAGSLPDYLPISYDYIKMLNFYVKRLHSNSRKTSFFAIWSLSRFKKNITEL